MALHEFLASSMISASFHDETLMREFWKQQWGVTNSVGQIRKVLVHRPDREVLALQQCRFEDDAGALVLRDEHGRIRSYCLAERAPDLELMQSQHDALTQALRSVGAEVIDIKGDPACINRLFMRDVGMVIPGGIVLSRFALRMRYGETKAAFQALAQIGIPVLAMIQGEGFAEGGSFAVLDSKTAIVGRSVRVNCKGIEQLRQILSWQDMNLIVLDMPARLIHLDEAFVMIDVDKALVDAAVLPHWFLKTLTERGIRPIQVHPDDPPMTINCLTMAPGKVLFPATGVRTIERLIRYDVDVVPIDVSEINKMGGGIHCATLELVRDEIE